MKKPMIGKRHEFSDEAYFACLTPEAKLVGLSTDSLAAIAGPVELLTPLKRLDETEYREAIRGYSRAIFSKRSELDDIGTRKLVYKLLTLGHASNLPLVKSLKDIPNAGMNEYSEGAPITSDSVMNSPYVVEKVNEERRNTIIRRIKKKKHEEAREMLENGSGSMSKVKALWDWNGPVALPEEIPETYDDYW